VIGDWLYNITEMERVSQPAIERYSRRVTTSQAAANVISSIPAIPRDKILMVLFVMAEAIGGGAQVLASPWASIYTNYVPGGSLWSSGTIAANPRHSITLIGNPLMLLLGGETLNADYSFSAGAVANAVTIMVHGLLLPRGSIQPT